MSLKKPLLIFSSLTIVVIASLYGISPKWFVETFLSSSTEVSVDQSHVFRAVMMLYISLGFFWFYCAFSEKMKDVGIIVLAVFCGGLVSGRLLSMALDGMPSTILSVYTLMELGLVPICIFVLKRDPQKK